MPGRAIRNEFIRLMEQGRAAVRHCFGCIRNCDPGNTPYCITQALINAVKGDLDHGLIFCGAKVDKIREMTTVAALMRELAE